MEVNITIDRDFKAQVKAVWLRALAKAILTAQGAGKDTEVSLLITGQERIRELNRQYRSKDRPTDVLSFPMQAEAGFIAPPDGVRHLGEVIISYPQAASQAEEHRHSTNRELAILLIHGILHLLGYDHETDAQHHEMSAREKELLTTVEEKL